jgi:hypothetical protein
MKILRLNWKTLKSKVIDQLDNPVNLLEISPYLVLDVMKYVSMLIGLKQVQQSIQIHVFAIHNYSQVENHKSQILFILDCFIERKLFLHMFSWAHAVLFQCYHILEETGVPAVFGRAKLDFSGIESRSHR